MDRLKQIRGEAGGSGDSTLDTTSSPSEAFMSANESNSKYFSLSDISTFDIEPIKDVSLASTTSKDETLTDPGDLISNLSPIGKKDILDDYKIGKQIEAGSILSGGVNIFEDNDNSFDGNELVIDDNVVLNDKPVLEKVDEQKAVVEPQPTVTETKADEPSENMQVILQIDGRNVEGVGIGNGIYLYRELTKELAAVQITNNGHQQSTYKFLKVRENLEGNLEVYEEFEIEVPPTDAVENPSHVPNKDINKVISDQSSNKVAENSRTPQKVSTSSASNTETKDGSETADGKTEINFNGKMMKFSETRTSPVVGTFTPMTYHSTPNKEGKPLTKTMVDFQLHPNRYPDMVKKTIEVHTDSNKQKPFEIQSKPTSEDIVAANVSQIIEQVPSQVAKDEKRPVVDDANVSVENKDVNPIESTITPEKQETPVAVESNKDDPGKEKVSLDKEEATVEKAKEEITKDVPVTESESLEKGVSREKEETSNKETVLPLDVTVLPLDETISPAKEEDTIVEKEIELVEEEKVTVEEEKVTAEEAKSVNHDIIKDLEAELKEIKPNSTENTDQIVSINDNQTSVEKEENLRLENELKSILLDQNISVVNDETVTEVEPISVSTDQKTSVQDEVNITESKPSSSSQEEIITNFEISEVDTLDNTASVATVNCIADHQNSEKNEENTTIETVKEPEKSTENIVTENIDDDDKLVINEELNKPSEMDIIKDDLDTEQKTLIIDEKPNRLGNEVTKSNEIVVETTQEIKSNVQDEVNIQQSEEKTISKTETKETINIVAITVENDIKEKPIKTNEVVQAKVEVVDKKPLKKEIIHNKLEDKKEIPKINSNPEVKPINNNHAAVPFGQWTAANRQEFLNKFKDTYKAPANSNTKQIKNSNDLNRRDVLKKIDSQRQQSNIASSKDKICVKNETIFSSNLPVPKPPIHIPQTKLVIKKDSNEPSEVKPKVVEPAKGSTKEEQLPLPKPKIHSSQTKHEVKKDSNETSEVKPKVIEPAKSSTKQLHLPLPKPKNRRPQAQANLVVKKDSNDPSGVKQKVIEPTKSSSKEQHKVSAPSSTMTTCTVSGTNVITTETSSRRQVNVNDLINKTIEDMMHHIIAKPKTQESKSVETKGPDVIPKQDKSKEQKVQERKVQDENVKELDEIESKMNELHGIPFVERPAHQLPKFQKKEVKTYSKADQEKSQNKGKLKIEPPIVKPSEAPVTGNVVDIDSEEEVVIEHEPVTGDINKKPVTAKLPVPQESKPVQSNTKSDAVITENEFDKFVRRNSVTYEDHLTVNFDKKESNSIQNAKNVTKALSKPKNEIVSFDPKSKLPLKQPIRQNVLPNKPTAKNAVENPNNTNYQSKIHRAYQTVLTAKKDQQSTPTEERPLTIIEDKPVKVVFVDSGTGFNPGQLNAQGKELSPTKKPDDEATVSTVTSSYTRAESVESDMVEFDDKLSEDSKTKTKHQRKQVLTPVETPDLEIIQPEDLGFVDNSQKKKRKTDDNKNDKQVKNLVHKKSYLLGRTTADDKWTNTYEISKTKIPSKETVNEEVTGIKNTSSALDNLVKAAELIEHQSENRSNSSNSNSPQGTPFKRGRGRPRKYPTPEVAVDAKLPSPQKKPRLIDAKPVKESSISDSDTSDDEMIKENWTMGKINENIVCPICNKLFRSENVVFKHVKHCTGVSPNRSESDKQSPSRGRRSQESDLRSLDSRSEDMDIDSEEKSIDSRKYTPRKRKTQDSHKFVTDKNEVIVIEDTPPIKERKNEEDIKEKEKKKIIKPKLNNYSNGLVCEICGKTFRQLSYLVNHRLQHKKEEPKKIEKPTEVPSKTQVFSCEVCKKEFRKLHHLVQHRIIHNPSVPSRTLRKSSLEQSENKTIKDTSKEKEQPNLKHSDDPSAGFRCEPCDKSFRKLHHLVEHRETHDGINRQKTVTNPAPVVEKPLPSPPQCEVCKKTFRKLHHLIEHKEQHVEPTAEKSNEKEKNAKSALSTKDIIHECSLCYMVFPNEHSLNKHSVNCQKKKRQSKLVKTDTEETPESNEENSELNDPDVEIIAEPKIIAQEIIDDDDEDIEPAVDRNKIDESVQEREIKETNVDKPIVPDETQTTPTANKDKVIEDISQPPVQKENAIQVIELPSSPLKRDLQDKAKSAEKEVPVVPEKIKKIEEKDTKIKTTSKKKTQVKTKLAPNVTNRQKSESPKPTSSNDVKPLVDSSDDDEVRYMLNPDFKVEETEGKTFMKVRANKRNSLQIERPNSKDLVKRRTSLQHPPKIPRLKAKPVEPAPKKEVEAPASKKVHKVPNLDAAPATDSDDSDVKYSFPKTISEKIKPERTPKEVEKKPGRKSAVQKRKSLAGIAKRKSLGEAITSKHKVKPSPVKVIRKRTTEVEHRCDCGQLFSSAALLSRHTSLAHTPPRIRRRRSPPPDTDIPKASRKSTEKPKPSRISSVKSDVAAKSRKSNKQDATTPETRKSMKVEAKTGGKTKRVTPAHRGVPVPEKMRKMMMKMKT